MEDKRRAEILFHEFKQAIMQKALHTGNKIKGALAGLAIGIALLCFIYSRWIVSVGTSSVDLHFRDTYVVFDPRMAILLCLLVLGTFFSVGGLIGTRFRSNRFRVLLLIFLLMDALCLVYFYRLFA